MAMRPPPRFVPTLTEVVRRPPQPDAPPSQPSAAPVDEEELVHRVLQRIDLTLDRRLREAIAATVLEQTRTLGPVLREQIEEVVREAVSEALSAELGGSPHQRR